MYRVLFVDDEPDLLSTIRRLLKRKEPSWECKFANSGAAGLAELEKAHKRAEQFDVVVADMRMPNMDGPTFLAKVRDDYPQVIRIVLSGAADMEANLRVIPVAHQYLKKPFDLNSMRETITRSCDLRDTLKGDAVRNIVTQLDGLPVRPGIYSDLSEALSSPTTSMEEVGRIVEQDPGMSAKVLQMVNSAFFGTKLSVTSVQQAVTFLGLPQIRQLLLVLEVFESFDEPADKKLRYFSMNYERKHALLTAKIARRLAPVDDADHAFTAGVLHDVGKLVLASHMPDVYGECFHRSLLEDRPIEELEKQLVGATHAEVGGYLLALWGLPDPVVEAVAFHHDPDLVQHDTWDVVSAVHVANYLAEVRPQKPLYQREVDNVYLARLGVEDKLEGWIEIADEIFRGEWGDEPADDDLAQTGEG